jgi:hypothetical protein
MHAKDSLRLTRVIEGQDPNFSLQYFSFGKTLLPN